MIKRCLTSLVATLIVCFLACSSASARVCFLPDSTDCGEGDVAGSGNVDVPCQYSNCPAYNTKYQTCYTERIYNNGGVNVECKQVKCSLSKSDCEKKEADPNSSQCCNFDSASGCYYMGSCKLCNRDVYDSEKNLGEGYDCHPCKDKNGTFYNCTAKEKECYQINSNYTSKCADSQTAEKVEGVKDSKGNQCYTCKDKPLEIIKPVITITYKETYNSLTPGAAADPEEYYYKTLKFTATSSDNISRTILMKTYPAITCSKPQYTTGSPVTINEGTETIIGSRCGTQSRQLFVSSVAALDTFINGTKVYSFEPHESSHFVFDGLDGKTVETNDYTIKFVERKSCADLGYVSDYCSSEQYAHYTGVTDSHNDKCYTCEPYDSKKTCKEIGLQFGKNLVGEETGCAGSGIEGKVFTYEWAYDEAGEAIQGSDGDCIICKPTSEVNIYTSNSKCYKITSITGDNVVKIAERHYSVPLESNFTINAEKDLTSSKWNTGYCKSIYPYIEIDNMSSAYERTKQYSYKESKTFTLNDDFLKEYKIVENEMSVSPVEEPVTYTAELYLDNDDCPYVEGICPSAGIVVSDASDDEYMKDVSVDVVMSINCCGEKDRCTSPFPNIIFDGEAWWNHHYTSAESYCSYTFGTSEFRIYKRSEGKYIATIKGFGCAKINDGAIEICIQQH